MAFRLPKRRLSAPPSAGWARVGAGVAVGVGAAEFQSERAAKLGTRAGAAPSAASVAPKVGWGLAPG